MATIITRENGQIECQNEMLKMNVKTGENEYTQLNHKGIKIFKLSKKINQKKSMYYQINICGNHNSDSKLKYIFNNSESITIKNDIYQEFSLDSIKSYIIQFDSETTGNNNNGLFKYFYGQANLLKTINNFSKEIFISKNTKNNNNQLVFKFQSPFNDMIDIKIILISDSQEKYDDICSLIKFLEKNKNLDENTNKNTKIIEKKLRIRENKENKVEIGVEKEEIKDFLNKNVDIYVLVKSIGSNLEISYDIKKLVIDWNQLNEGNDNEQMDNNGKKLICINCGLYGEQKKDNDANIDENRNNENNNVNNSNDNINNNNNDNNSNEMNNVKNNDDDDENNNNKNIINENYYYYKKEIENEKMIN
jgi:hypothetical protein